MEEPREAVTAMKVELLQGVDGIEQVAGDWERMFAASACEPSTSLEWTRALLETHVHSGDCVATLVVRDGTDAVAIVPLLLRRERLVGPLQVRTVSPLSEAYNTHSDLLRADGRPGIIAALFSALRNMPEHWDVLRLGRLLESGSLAAQLTAEAASAGLLFRIRREQPSYFLDLDGGYAAFLSNRSSKFRNHLARAERRLRACGHVAIRIAGHEIGADAAFEDLLAVERKSWKQKHGTAITAISHQEHFYRRLCIGAVARHRLHLMLLYLNGQPVAFNLGLLHAGRYSYLKTSFDEAIRHASPATVLRARLIEALAAEGVAVLDFPAEPYQWEAQWTRSFRWHQSLLVFNRTRLADALRWLGAIRDAWSRNAGEVAIEHGDPRATRARSFNGR